MVDRSTRTVAFGELLEGGTRNGIYKPKEFHGTGVKIVNMGELFAHPRLHSVPMKRLQVSHNEREKLELRPGDLLFARRSLVADGAGKCAVVLEVDEPTVFESSIIRTRPDPTKADSLYLYYLFSSPIGAYLLDTIRRDAVVAGITGSDLVRLRLDVPHPSEQRAIARMLGALDDKIELNRRLNETLEEMARAVFKSWFIDFDPVRAKIAGCAPAHMDPATAALFPDALVESEVGLAPAGWQVGRLDDLLVLQRGFDLPTSTRTPGHFPVIQASGPTDGHTEAKVVGPGVVTGRSGVLGKVFFIERDFWPLNTTLWVKEFRASSPHHAYFLLQTLDFATYNSGSAVPTLNRNHVHGLPTLIPPSKVVQAFDAVAQPLLARRFAGDRESLVLREVRDLLLPKLLSGELCVREAEREVEKVA